jgi:hypothetical protein
MLLGRIRLNVTFGQPDNFHKEPLTFKVIDFPSTYHALLGRSCYAKFMFVRKYTYLKLKMPSPKGVIIVEGSFEQAYYCEQDYITQAAALVTPCAPDGPNRDVGRAPMEGVAKAAAKLDRSSIDRAAKTLGDSGGSVGPSI